MRFLVVSFLFSTFLIPLWILSVDLGRFLWEAETLAEWGRYVYVLCDTYPVRNVETRDGR